MTAHIPGWYDTPERSEAVKWQSYTQTKKSQEFRHWYSLFVMTGREGAVKAEFEREFTEAGLDAVVLVPKRELEDRKDGVDTTVHKEMFPGYVIIGTAQIVEVVAVARKIKNVPSVLSYSDGNFSEIQLDEISYLIYMLDNNDVVGTSGIEFDEENQIHILEGVLKGKDGWITQVDRRKGRVDVWFALTNMRREIWLSVRVVGNADNKTL